MNNLLIFFAFPIAVIIISVILQKNLNNPIAVAALTFAIFLVITFAFFDETFLIATLAYTILAFITAFIAKVVCNFNSNNNDTSNTEEENNICRSMVNNSTNTINNTLNSNSNLNDYGYRYNRYRR